MKRRAIVLVLNSELTDVEVNMLLTDLNNDAYNFKKIVDPKDYLDGKVTAHEYDDMRERNGGEPLCGPVFYIP